MARTGATPTCHVVNLQPTLGGAEVYTMFFARALRAAGCEVVLHINQGAGFWDHLAGEGVRIVPAASDVALLAGLPAGAWIVTQAPVSSAFVEAARRVHWLSGFCHMPLAGRRAGVLARYHLVYAVSAYVASTLGAAGVPFCYDEPLYGIAEFSRGQAAQPQPVRALSPYSWDRRKWRDRTLSVFEPIARRAAKAVYFNRRPDSIVLGIVSSIGPIKQFDVLFGLIAPHLARHPRVTLEIFGSGGYRSVADLRRALTPLSGRVRFWGQQERPGDIYPQLDFLMSGLPEKEALGLNILEAQAHGVPVLAVDAPPFRETVSDGVTGFLYPDPRADGGAGFARVFERALHAPPPDIVAARDHLARFSRASFEARVVRLVADAGVRLRAVPVAGADAVSIPALVH
jgi:glycosyltransferase involved in cell wall biosynthesis